MIRGADRRTELQVNQPVHSRFFQKTAAFFMSAVVVFVLLFSVFYLVEEAEHDCIGEGCPVCDCLTWCGHFQHQLFDGVVAQAVGLLPVVCGLVGLITLAEGISMPTLITWKVRLNP